MSLISLLTLALSLLGIYFFITSYRSLENYLPKFSQVIGVVFIFYLASLLWKVLAYGEPTNFRELFINAIVFMRNIALASIGAHFLAKHNLTFAPLLFHFQRNTNKPWRSFFIACITATLLMLSITAVLLFITSNSVIKPFSSNIGDIVSLGFHAILGGVAEEIFFRLFMQALFINWFGKKIPGLALSIILSSSIWALSHPGIFETEGIKFIQIFLLGIVLGVLMLKRGWESCCLAHIFFNFIAYLFFVDFQSTLQ